MTNRNTLLPFVLGLSFLPCVSRSAEQTHPAAPPTLAHVYTNDDLERVRPFRDELGARTVPAEPAPDRETATSSRRGAARAPERSARHDEAYWRREAEKLRERLRRLADQREELRTRLAERREVERRALGRTRSSRSSGTRPDRALETRIAALERRMRDLEEDLADRARRAGALPGWLR